MEKANPEQLAVALTSVVGDLSTIRRRLKRLERGMPESNARADIQCGIVDRLSPLIESLKVLRRSATKPKRSSR